MSETVIGNNGPTDEELKAFIREARTQKRACDEANGLLRSIYKRAKAAGVNVAAMRATMAAIKKDPDEVIADTRAAVRMMALCHIEMTQADLFGDQGLNLNVSEEAQHADALWTAQDDGYRSGRNGTPMADNPCETGSEMFDVWRRGWIAGSAAIARELGESVKLASGTRKRAPRKTPQPPLIDAPRATAKRGRGRPPGSPNKRKRVVEAMSNGDDAPAVLN